MGSLAFTKMEGAGNDYVYVDAIHDDFDPANGPRLAPILADRHFGIGGDGLIALAPSNAGDADFRMIMWNADGSRGAMCGNGLRCLAKLAWDRGILSSPAARVETDVGIREIELVVGDRREVLSVIVDMGDVKVSPEPEEIELLGGMWSFHAGDAGNPHAVMFFEEDPDELPVLEVGAAFQNTERFPDGVNVEFVRVVDAGSVRQRTFERGSGETLACGSGATAVGLAAILTGRMPGPRVEVHLRGGTLIISRRSSTVVMEGPARTVYAGSFPLPES